MSNINTNRLAESKAQSPLWHALKLAEQGRAVFPMNPQTKRPACAHGLLDATRDPDTIRAWFTRPGPVPAVATGAPSGVVVLDLDRQHGAASWWQENRDQLPKTEAYRSKSGGLHLVFLNAPGIRTVATGQIGDGVELRSTGASAIYWPAAGLPLLCDASPAPLPSWIMPPPKPAQEPSPWRADDEPRPPHHVEASLAGLVRNVAAAGHGERNARLHWSACRAAEMSARGEISRRHVEAVLIEAASRCGLDHREAAGTIASAYRAGGR